ncbi:hypothetical protein GQ600_14076 [Phytophthora cactorum]|nr:hypothetical protein GQ600_14076 [Phytophthora cactorum]
MIHMTLPHVVRMMGLLLCIFLYVWVDVGCDLVKCCWIKRAEVQDVVIELEGITHPLVEGPLGPSVCYRHWMQLAASIDQTYVDTSDNVLAKARVVLSSLSLRVTEGDVTGAQYTVSLSAPPYANTALTLSVGDSATRAKLTLDPDSLVFSASNWSTPAKITVTASNDFVVSGTSTQESTRRQREHLRGINEVNVHISENDFPAVHISGRFLAVIEDCAMTATRSLYVATKQQGRCSDDTAGLVYRDVSGSSGFVNTPKVINVVASVAASTVPATSGIFHQLSSADNKLQWQKRSSFPTERNPDGILRGAIRAGWFPLVNTTTGGSQCVGCPLGHFCAGSCAAPRRALKALRLMWNLHMTSVLVWLLDWNCARLEHLAVIQKQAPAVSYWFLFKYWRDSVPRMPSGDFNNETFQSTCSQCPEGSYCPKGSTNSLACAQGLTP